MGNGEWRLYKQIKRTLALPPSKAGGALAGSALFELTCLSHLGGGHNGQQKHDLSLVFAAFANCFAAKAQIMREASGPFGSL